MNTKLIFVLFVGLIFGGCTQKDQVITSSPTTVLTPTVVENKVCDWIDKSDIIVRVNVPVDIIGENSYEVGFYFSPIFSSMRIARKECSYRTGFNYSEFKGKGEANVGVRRYSDSTRLKIKEEPLSLSFDSEGKPSIGNIIEVNLAN